MQVKTPFQDFEPDRHEEQNQGAFRKVPMRMLVPNMLTLVALCAGLTAIRMGFEGRYEMAIAAIIIAAVLDALDGRAARLLKASSKFGAQLDSLADFVNFGVAPGILLYVWSLHDLAAIGWIAGMVFAICMALRLARFNVAQEDKSKPEWLNAFFVGVPAPAGAIVVMLPLYLGLVGVSLSPWLVLLYVLFVAFLVVSALPTFSGKHLGSRVASGLVLPVFVAVVIYVAMLFSYPAMTMTLTAVIYLLFLPVGYFRYHDLKQQHGLVRGSKASGRDPMFPEADLEETDRPERLN